MGEIEEIEEMGEMGEMGKSNLSNYLQLFQIFQILVLQLTYFFSTFTVSITDTWVSLSASKRASNSSTGVSLSCLKFT